jgi:hypothetical protein
MALLPLLSGIGQGLSAGAGSSSTTDSSFESTTDGTSQINRTELPPGILKALQSILNRRRLASNMRVGTGALRGQLKTLQENTANPFNVEDFVNGIMTQANNTINNQASEAINLGESDIGGTQGNNSMSALLANKIAIDSASQLAGIKADATARGEEIARQESQLGIEGTVALTGQMNKGLTDFLALLRGAKTKQNQKTTEHTQGTSTSTTSSPFNPMEFLGGVLGSFKAPT